MKFKLRVPEDGTLLNREFDIIPQSGTILPQSNKQIKVEFLSNTIKKYHYSLALDVGEVGDALYFMPITAECIVPDVLISSSKINFGDCFIGYKYQQTLDLGNKSNMPAKYEVMLPSEEEENKQVQLLVDSKKGVVPSKSTHKIKISITTTIIGNIYMPLYIRIIGSEKPPHEISVHVCSIGPIVSVQNGIVDWGKINVLEEHTQTLRISNKCPIPAPIALSFKSSANLFKCERDSIVVDAASDYDLPLSVNVDDVLKFSDELTLSVLNGEVMKVNLVASGKGSPIVPSIPLDTVSFDNQFSQRSCFKKFTLTNMGRRVQALQWSLARARKKDVRIQFCCQHAIFLGHLCASF